MKTYFYIMVSGFFFLKKKIVEEQQIAKNVILSVNNVGGVFRENHAPRYLIALFLKLIGILTHCVPVKILLFLI